MRKPMRLMSAIWRLALNISSAKYNTLKFYVSAYGRSSTNNLIGSVLWNQIVSLFTTNQLSLTANKLCYAPQIFNRFVRTVV